MIFFDTIAFQLIFQVHLILLYERNFRVYLHNFVLVLFVITSFSFFGWAIAWQKAGSRVSFNAILLLASVVFKQLLTRTAPPVPYLTRLDIYAHLCFGFLSLSTAMHAILGFIIDTCNPDDKCTFIMTNFHDSDAKANDLLLLLAWTFTWLAANSIFAFDARFRMIRARNSFSIEQSRLCGFHPANVIQADFKESIDVQPHVDEGSVSINRNSSTERVELRKSLLEPISESDQPGVSQHAPVRSSSHHQLGKSALRRSASSV